MSAIVVLQVSHSGKQALSKCCAGRVEEALRASHGVVSVEPQQGGQRYVVTVDETAFVTLESLAVAVATAGNYSCHAEGVREHILQVRGMAGVGDHARITHALKAVEGVIYAAVSPESEAVVIWTAEDRPIPMSRLQEVIRSCYSCSSGKKAVSPIKPEPGSQDPDQLVVQPRGGPGEQELVLRLGSAKGQGSMPTLLSPSMMQRLEAVPGVVTVEPVEQQRAESGINVEEVRVFFRSQHPVALEALQTAALQGGAQIAEVGGVRHALDGVTFGTVADRIHGQTSEVVLTVRGLNSMRCASLVQQSLERVAGVKGVSVLGPQPSGTCPSETSGSSCGSTREPGGERKVLVSLDVGAAVTVDMLSDAVERWAPQCCGRVRGAAVPGAGQVLVSLSGVDTKEKASNLSSKLAEVPGVVYESISIAEQEVLIIGQPSLKLLLKAVQEAGYSAEVSHLVSMPLKPPSTPDGPASSAPSKRKAVILVQGMTCSSCSNAVEHSLGNMTGVLSAQVNLLTEKAVVEYDSAAITVDQMLEEIDSIGYDAELQEEPSHGSRMTTARLLLGDMSCANCANNIESVLRSQRGVESASVNFSIEKATVTFDSAQTGLRTLVEAVEEAGYSAVPESWDPAGKKGAQNGKPSEASKWRMLFWWALLCALPIASITMGLMHLHLGDALLNKELLPGLSVANLICGVLATASQFGPPGLKFYKDAGHGLLRCSPNMALLVTLGTTVSYIYGAFGVVLGLVAGQAEHWPNDYFEVSADLIAFITLGKFLEARAKGATSAVLQKLLDLKPRTAILLTVDEEGQVTDERSIPVEQLQAGDMLKVVRGAAVPADGVILVGTAEVDESMLTGESMPVTKSVDEMLMGATVVREGTVYMRITSIGGDTVLSQIVRMIEDAQTSKPPVQALADAISQVFVPAIIATSLLVFAGWMIAAQLDAVPHEWMRGKTPLAFALNMGIASMVVACPCAMGLAVPTALMVGTGIAAHNGILIKTGEAIEFARKVTSIIFDKTGTLTEGKPQVSDMMVFTDKVPEEEVIRLTGTAETNSEHPLGRALVSYAQHSMKKHEWMHEAEDEGGILATSSGSSEPHESQGSSFLGTPTEFTAESGKGLQCQVDGKRVTVGKMDWMAENKVKGISEEVHAAAAALEEQAKTAVLVAIDLQIAAVFGVADAPRPESPAVLAALKKMGITPWMVTGDNYRTAYSVADGLGLPRQYVMAEVMPGNKARQVKLLQEQGHTVAMVGDGINDAPALAQADLGMAIGNGTDIAIEAAGMVLMGSSLAGVVTAIDISRAIHRRIWTNFGWAFVYNLVLIPAAAGAAFPLIGATLPAWAAGAAMAMSSVSVVASSLMLNLYHPPKLPPAHTAQQSGLKDLRQVVIDSRRAASSAHGLQEPLLQDLRSR